MMNAMMNAMATQPPVMSYTGEGSPVSFVREFRNFLAASGINAITKAPKCVALLVTCLQRDSSARLFLEEWLQQQVVSGNAYTLDEAIKALTEKFWTTTLQTEEYMAAHAVMMMEHEAAEHFVERFQKARRLADAAAAPLGRNVRSSREWADVFVCNLRPSLRQQIETFLKMSAADKVSHPNGYNYELDHVCKMALVYAAPPAPSARPENPKKRRGEELDRELLAQEIKMALQSLLPGTTVVNG